MPRPPKLTPPLQAGIVNAVSIGVPYLQAALLAGIGQSTAMQWRQRGEGTHRRPQTPLFVAFVEAIKKAEAEDQARRVARIEQAARGGAVVYEKETVTEKADGSKVTVREVRRLPPQWVADAWHLERTDPKRWGRRDRLDVHTYRDKIAAKARELGSQFGVDPEALIARAERLANGLQADEGSDG
jgi:hypothetical protein